MPSITTTTATVHGGEDEHDHLSTTTATTASSKFSLIPHDIIRSHILPQLDGPTLASTSTTTPELHTLITSDTTLWTHLCQSTWPSTTTPLMRHVISTFPNGPRSFYSLSYPSPLLTPSPPPHHHHHLPASLISAVDIFYRRKCIFSTVQETDTTTGWFRCAPFRVDLLGPKESVPTPIRRPSHEDTCRDLYADLQLSWVVVDPTRRLAANVSSLRPVSVEKHWLTGEVHVRFATVVGHVILAVDITCVGCGPGGLVLHVTEVCLRVEGMDGTCLVGKDSLVNLQRVLEGKRGNCRREVGEERKRYMEYLQMRREWKESKSRREGRLDVMCVVFGFGFVVALFCWSCVLAVLLRLISLPLFRADQLRTRIRFIPA